MNPVDRLRNLYPEYQRPRNIRSLAQVLGLIEENPNLSPQKYCELAGISLASFKRYKRELKFKGLINNKLIATYKTEVKLVKETPKPDLKLVKETPKSNQPVVTPGVVLTDAFWERLQDNPLAQYVITIAQSPPGTIFFEDTQLGQRMGETREQILKYIGGSISVDKFMDLFAMYAAIYCPDKMAELKSLEEESVFHWLDLESLVKPYQTENGSHSAS